MSLEEAKVFDAKAKIFVLQQRLVENPDLKEVREITEQISALENTIDSNEQQIEAGKMTKIRNKKTVKSSVNLRRKPLKF
jgi:hypothetical protein